MGFPGGSNSKEFACNTGNLGLIPGQEDPLEKGMATHFSFLVWRIPWLQSMEGCKEDVLGLLIVTSTFGFVALFFGSITNDVWQEILSYFKYLSLFVSFFLILDLVLSMFKLIQINAELNKIAARDREN